MSNVMKVLDEARYCLGLDNRDAIASQLLEAQLEIARILAASPAHDGGVVYQLHDGGNSWLDVSYEAFNYAPSDQARRIVHTAPPRVVWFDGKSPPRENGLPVLCKVEFDEGYFFDVGEYDDDHWITPSLEKPAVFTNARVVSWTHLEPITAGQES